MSGLERAGSLSHPAIVASFLAIIVESFKKLKQIFGDWTLREHYQAGSRTFPASLSEKTYTTNLCKTVDG
jgi:hypothetical protein